MEILFLGTAAATATPLPFCRCPACQAGRREGGKNLRRRSSVLIDGEILIDLGPDFVSACFESGVSSAEIGCLLQTHSHSDHFDAGHLITRIPEYATENPQPMQIVASGACLAHMSERLAREEEGATLLAASWREKLGVEIVRAAHGDRLRYKNYEIHCLESAHAPSDESMMYIVRKGDAAFFYACDTPLFTQRTWEALEKLDFPITAAAVDQTYGPDTPGGGHLYANQVAEIAARLKNTRVLATHISHEGTPPHEEMDAWTRARGYETAWDGLKIQL